MRLSILIVALLIAGCDEPKSSGLSIGSNSWMYAPFEYHGFTMIFPKGSVDTRSKDRAWIKLIPDAPESGDAIDARYYIDVGRESTGFDNGFGYHLGYEHYKFDEPLADLGDGYKLYCNKNEGIPLLFTCAVLLHSVPFAAIQFRDRPHSAKSARKMVDEAERFLQKSKTSSTVAEASEAGQQR